MKTTEEILKKLEKLMQENIRKINDAIEYHPMSAAFASIENENIQKLIDWIKNHEK